ncbi:2-aminoethylphosphonate--pyruvate transaminase, partial [Bacteroides thetaiotaomicron]|nr:2-aminoethylphosphonate--pyruvate transaminase [Bacteroides thetaiotaomicron]
MAQPASPLIPCRIHVTSRLHQGDTMTLAAQPILLTPGPLTTSDT